MKKLIFGLAFLASFGVMANGALPVIPPQVNYFDGFYLGVGAGVATAVSDWDHVANDAVINVIQDQQFMLSYHKRLSFDNLGAVTPAGNLFLGFGKALKSVPDFYLGIQGSWTYAPFTMKGALFGEIPNPGDFLTTISNEVSNHVELTNKYAFALALKLGYLIHPNTMLYLLAGTDWTKIHYITKHRLMAEGISSPKIVDFSTYDSHHKELFGLMPGIGLETMFSDHWSVGLQYTYSFYKKHTHDANFSYDPIVIGDLTFTRNSSTHDETRLSRNLFLLTFTYHFNQ